MIICSCNVLTDREVRTMLATAFRLPTTTGQVYKCLGCRPKCGRCARSISLIMDEAVGALGESRDDPSLSLTLARQFARSMDC